MNETYASWMAYLGGRKFLFGIAVTVLATVMLILKYIDQGTWERMVIWAAGIYGLANVAQKVTTTQTENKG